MYGGLFQREIEKKMTLHPQISRNELFDYCQLCHENGVKSVKVDTATLNAIKGITVGQVVCLGVKFKVEQ